MSTKAILDVLETVAAGKPLSEDAPEVARRALRELLGLRDAAKTATDCGTIREPYVRSDAVRAAFALLDRVGKGD